MRDDLLALSEQGATQQSMNQAACEHGHMQSACSCLCAGTLATYLGTTCDVALLQCSTHWLGELSCKLFSLPSCRASIAVVRPVAYMSFIAGLPPHHPLMVEQPVTVTGSTMLPDTQCAPTLHLKKYSPLAVGDHVKLPEDLGGTSWVPLVSQPPAGQQQAFSTAQGPLHTGQDLPE
jgi:hypothetical protein